MNNIYEWVKERRGALARLIVLAFGLVNSILQGLGYNILPVTDEQIVQVLSDAGVILSALWCYWKNNSLTKPAITGDSIMRALKQGLLVGDELGFDDEELEVIE